MRKIFFILLLCLGLGQFIQAQQVPGDSMPKMLLLSNDVRIQSTNAIDALYNFKFEEADRQFHYLKQFYPNHPLPYFLYALGYRWRILPNIDRKRWDEDCFAYLDTAITHAERLYEENNNNLEAAFFLAAGYGFEGWLHSERKNWGKATNAARKALEYMEINRGNSEWSPEFLFGEGLYNYYVEWVPENYPMLRMVTAFFPDGDKQKGIEQLHTVIREAFYTRVEAMYFLTRIYAFEQDKDKEALDICRMLMKEYPDNAYFHRIYTRLLYENGHWKEMYPVAKELLRNVEAGMPGYEENSGRYAGFFLGTYMEQKKSQPDSAITYYKKAVKFSRNIDETQVGYYLYSLYNIGDIYMDREDWDQAIHYFDECIGDGKRKHSAVQKAKDARREARKKRRKEGGGGWPFW